MTGNSIYMNGKYHDQLLVGLIEVVYREKQDE